jgi:hypothetical protein
MISNSGPLVWRHSSCCGLEHPKEKKKMQLRCNFHDQLVGGFKHDFYFQKNIWDIYNPSHWRTHIFFRGVGIPPKRGYFLLSRLMGFTTIVIYSHQQPLACTPRIRWMEYPQSWLLIGAKLRFLVSAPGMPGQRHRALGHEESDGYRGVERCNETPRMVILVN